MTTQNSSIKQIKILDEIIDNAIGLPIESQDLLLMIAKAMRYTRDCISCKNEIEQPHNASKNKPA